MRIEDYRNELGLTRKEMRIWAIVLLVLGLVFLAMIIDTNITLKELDALMPAGVPGVTR